MRSIKHYLLIFSLFYINFFSQQGSFDPTFNPLDTGLGEATNEVINTAVLQPDNKIIIGGTFTKYSDVTANRIARINEDGTLDTSFNAANLFAGLVQSISNLTLQPDGKIIATGSFSEKIVRINSDGSKDTSFNIGNAFSGNIYGLYLQPNGKILISGDLIIGSQSNTRIIRLNSNGTIDSFFTTNGTVDYVYLQPDGKILASGGFDIFNGVSVPNWVVRINADGTMDSSFNTPSTLGHIEVKAVAADGKIYANSSVNSVNSFVRLNNDGTIDNTFNAFTSFDVVSLNVQQNGKIIIGGNLSSTNTINKLIRLNSDGTLDTSFDGNDGPLNEVFNGSSTPRISKILIQPDEKIIIVGKFTYIKGKKRNNIARVLNNGPLDLTYNKNMGFDGGVSNMLELPDHKILVSGSFKNYNEVHANKIALLNEDGSLNSSFIGSVTNGNIADFALQADGKVIIVGSFTTYNNINSNYIARINQYGTLDTTFSIGTGASYYIRAVAIQPDGKILIGGDFSYINGAFNRRIARLNDDGSVDTTFACSVGTSNMGYVDQIVVQPDNKILITGYFPELVNISLRRINSNGSSDTSFAYPSPLTA